MAPIVLQHGLFGYGQIKLGKLKLSYFHKIDRALARRGHPLIVSRVHPTGPIEMRSAQLKATILDQLHRQAIKDRVVILAHSMGGLDARYMISKLGMAERVAALVTISTPHRGSSYADWVVENLGRRLRGMQLIKLLKLDLRALADLTTSSCTRFNQSVSDVSDVRYFSISAARPRRLVPAFLMHSHKIVSDCEGPNDGVVSVASAKWGEHLETWPADHLHVINKRLVPEIKHPTGDMVPYYLRALDRVLATLE